MQGRNLDLAAALDRLALFLELDYLKWGIDQARRGWLEPKDVVNTRDLPDLLRLLSR